MSMSMDSKEVLLPYDEQETKGEQTPTRSRSIEGSRIYGSPSKEVFSPKLRPDATPSRSIESDILSTDELQQLERGNERSWFDKLMKKDISFYPPVEEEEVRDPLHRRFNLPSSELLIEDYACALQEMILLQGRMYLFPRHVCFACDLLGSVRSIVIPYSEITDIRKAKTAYIIPNAIEITVTDNKYLFTSFLFRREAYKGLSNFWAISKGISRALESTTDQQLGEEEEEDDPEGPESEWPDSSSVCERAEQAEALPQTLVPEVPNMSPGEKVQGMLIKEGSAGDSVPEIDEDIVLEGLSHPPKKTSADLDETLDESAYPAVIVETTLIACDVVEFYRLFFSQSTGFGRQMHKNRGDTDVKVSDWNKLNSANSSYAREVQYTSPINTSLPSFVTKKTTRVREMQTCRLVKEPASFVLETSASMLEIPYGDCFDVCMRWDVRNSGKAKEVEMTVRGNVKFKKSCFFKSKITSDTIKELKKTYEKWVALAKEVALGNVEIPPIAPVRRKSSVLVDANIKAGTRPEIASLSRPKLHIESDLAETVNNSVRTPKSESMKTSQEVQSPAMRSADNSFPPPATSDWKQTLIYSIAALAVLYVIYTTGTSVYRTLYPERLSSFRVEADSWGRGGRGSSDLLSIMDIKIQLWQRVVEDAINQGMQLDSSCPSARSLVVQAAHADAMVELTQKEIDSVEIRLNSLKRQLSKQQEQAEELKKLLMRGGQRLEEGTTVNR
uniref:VASt domain-containing protein n=2 Tax=Guillardia theta TaxID=55529 RepID=A0A7S4P844_GUITH